ncbi:hypothetical protein OO013_13780 [Mangrovivirga sp. M17]|uniref:DUF4249 family protein n=1 Tax=Mangrovivirga halotolerans TaxID=2993936 RepID=A0ABT3RT20_9BACT|nr:hypothetical protein [Mangrovivirga halotolerans]MCX2744947.1 hypothetical protein [Mangrovivirga halotolerans]
MKKLNYIFLSILIMSCGWDREDFELPTSKADEIGASGIEINASSDPIINLLDLDQSVVNFEMVPTNENIEIQVVKTYVSAEDGVVETVEGDVYSTFPATVNDGKDAIFAGFTEVTPETISLNDNITYSFRAIRQSDGKAFPIAKTVAAIASCPVPEELFVGTYDLEDDQGLFIGPATITNAGGNARTITADYTIPGCCSFADLGFTFDLSCGQVFINEQSIGIGCGGGSNVDVVTPTSGLIGTFDGTDDTSFTISMFYSNPDCFGGFESTLTLTKQ